jgi:GT2 family glycosyltransferase
VIVVVVVTYSVPAPVLDRCLHSLLAAAVPEGEELRIVVVDNGARAVVPDDPRVEMYRSGRNGGFGAGANLGFRRAGELGASVTVLLNDDVEVDAGFLLPLLRTLDADPSLGAVQPLLLLSAEPPVVNSTGVRIGPDGAGVDLGYGEPLRDDHLVPGPIELFTGGAVAFRPTFLAETGGFDERYVLYYEDVDLARRGAELGWRYAVVPASRVIHAQGSSTGAIGERTVYLRERNRLWAAARTADGATVARALWLSARRLRHPPRRVHARALLAGAAGLPSRRWARHRAHTRQR